jgi:replicative DNA helicase
MAEANTSSGGSGSEHRPAPHDPEAEAQVIGAALSTASRYPRPNLIPSDFWVPNHRRLWELIITTQGPYKPGDLPEPLREAARACVSAWTGIDPAIPAKRIWRSLVARRCIEVGGDIITAGYDSRIGDIRDAVDTLSALLELVKES